MKSKNREPYLLDCSGKPLDLREKPAVMGILNITPDSFSDGGAFQEAGGETDIDLAVACALSMLKNGATIIDIGGESTRPGAEKVLAEEEIRRTIPVITELRKKTDALISIDTYKAEVAEAALRAGAQIVNDISGFTFDDGMPGVCSKYHAAAVLMHTPAVPGTLKWSTETQAGERNIMTLLASFFQQAIMKAECAGVHDVILDPGFGFGKSVHENFTILGNLGRLLKLGRPLLAGVSRKSFLGHAIRKPGEPEPPPKDRHDATTAAQAIALLNGAAVIRTHDVRAAADTAAVVGAIENIGE